MQNITKMSVFCLFSKGSLGRVLQKLVLIEQISIFLINFTNCLFKCITFVKATMKPLKNMILPSCVEELHTAKQGNDLKMAVPSSPEEFNCSFPK